MPRSGAATRGAIMDAAESLILDTGFAATSVDRIIERAGITKGAFFYHFDSKAALAHALIDRYAELDLGKLRDGMARAEALARDPLQQVLVFIGLLREEAATLAEPYPGCLFASYCYEAGLFDDEILETIRRTMLTWREELGVRFEEIARRRPPRLEVDGASLADAMTVCFEGAFIMSKSLTDPAILADQLGHYRNYVELLFSPDPAGG